MDKKAIVPRALRAKYDDWHFAPAIDSGGFVFVSGCTGTRVDGTISDDPSEQFRQAFQTVEISLIEAGLTYANMVEMTTYHIGLRDHLEQFKRVKDEFVFEPFSSWTAVGVSELAVEGAIIEISVIAKK
ncbi:MAG: RidA family protein [Arenicella sp.]